MDTTPRFTHIFRSLQPTILEAVSTLPQIILSIKTWTARCSERAIQSLGERREEYFRCTDATPYLGIASRRIYHYIRNELSIPFLRTKDLINLNPRSAHTHGECPPTPCEGPRTPIHPDAGRERKDCKEEGGNRTSEPEDLASIADGRGTDGHVYQFPKSSPGFKEKLRHSYLEEEQQQSRSPTVGLYISIIYEALRSGSLYGPISACLDEVRVA